MPLSICVIHVAAIGLVASAIGYIAEQSSTSLDVLDRPADQNAADQKDTFVPQPNHLPLFTRGSGTR